MPTFEFFLDSRGLITKEFEIDVTATLPKVTVQLFDGDDPVDLTGATVTFTLRDAAGAAVVLDAAATLLNATQGIVEYQLKAADVDDVGFFFAQFKITISSESYLIPNDSTQRLRLRIGKEDLPAFSSVPATLPMHAGSHDLGGSDQIALEALLKAPPNTILIDGNRTDPYTEDGGFARPFKTLESAFVPAPTGTDMTYLVRRVPAGYPLTTDPLVLPTGFSMTIFGLGGFPFMFGGLVWQPVNGSFLHIERFSIISALGTGLKVSNKDALFSTNLTLRDMEIFGGAFSAEILNEQASKKVVARARGFATLSWNKRVKFQPKNVNDELCLEGIDLEADGLETTADAVAARIDLIRCRIKHEGIIGGDPAQKIFAANCSTPDSDGTIAPLDAQDFRGLHTFKIAD